MKFGQNLPRNQVPEWSSSYINYKGLKKLIKSAQKDADAAGDTDLAEFFYALDRNLEDVDSFYNKKYAELARRLRLLYDRYGQYTKIQEEMDRDDLEDLIGTLLELRSQYRKLQWYGEVNRRGFTKITKKLDKKIASSKAQSRFLATKVDPKAFATNSRVINDQKAINEWLSTLGEVKTIDDNSSVHSTSSLQRPSSVNDVRIPTATLDALETAVRHDSDTELDVALEALDPSMSETQKNKLMLNLLHRAITCKSYKSIAALLKAAGSLDEFDDMNKRNCIHRYIISIGRARLAEDQANAADQGASQIPGFIPAAEFPKPKVQSHRGEERGLDKSLGKEDPALQLLTHILSHMKPEQQSALLARDMYGRLPLHYSAQYGLVATSEELIKFMQAWDIFDVSKGFDSESWQDIDGYAPLHLSVLGGHYRTTKALLLAENWKDENDDEIHARQRPDKSGAVLSLATKSNYHRIVELLVEAGVSVNYQDKQGETALHVAARFGFTACMEALLAGSDVQKADPELAERTYGWTPMFTACVDGNIEIVRLLIAAGAQVDKIDASGWTPIEHAALRGHLGISKILAELSPSRLKPSPPTTPAALPSGQQKVFALEDRSSNGTSKEANGRAPEPMKSFGHRYLTDESIIMVSLGSMDARKNIPAVKLDNVPLADAHSTQLDTALSVVVSAIGAKGEPTIIDLPVSENISTSPVTFLAKDPSKMKILFDIVPTYAGTKDKVLGRGVALLNTVRPGLGSNRINLEGDLSVPIVAANTLEVIGTANFNFLIITPFTHPNMHITEEQTYWKRTSTMIIGHRGLGKNMAAMKSLQLGENTIPSFIAASNLGASYVEFDVQLTKDHVPVIYHDFLVSETGIDAPVHTLTLEQFLHANQGQTPRASRPSSPAPTQGTKENVKYRSQRSYSLGAPDEGLRVDMDHRMKHTRDYKQKGFKANSRGNFIQAPFATLDDMFKKLPQSVGFNIEMKYPMLFESEEQEMDTYAVELNSFVDTVLAKVYELGQGRNIIFSSFHPDICLLLSFKQPSIPVLFLTDAGTSVVGDIRASSLQEAIRFASRWNLLGIVSAAEPLVTCPRLVRVVRQSGLLCFSYGTLNNDPKNVERQANEGIDAVIVDSVLAVRKGLTAAEQAAAVAAGVNATHPEPLVAVESRSTAVA